MATVSSKVLCVICNKGKGTFKCEGCTEIFCPKHSIEHRNDLSKQLEEIEVTHDLAYKTLIQQTQNLRQHSLIQKIDQWEFQSIDKIRQMADEARNQLLKGITEHTSNIKKKLQDLSDELRQGREDNDFLENDLQEWMQKIEELKLELLNPVNIVIQEDSTPLITRIRIDNQDISDSFEPLYSNNPCIQENDQLLFEDDSRVGAEIRGKNEYQIGSHTIRVRVEQLIQNGWIAFGIISKSESTQNNSYTAPSSYGWSNQNQIYIGGQSTNEETIEIIQNDIVELSIDCDQQKIELKNERSDRIMELSIDTDKSPLPWQYYINLRAANTHVQILNPSD
jgi:hypothetical protein